MKKSKKIKIAEGPSIIENFKPEDIKINLVWRTKAGVIDAPAYVRGPPKTVLMTNTLLDFIEFRMNQKTTFIERIFGKRIF